MKKTYLITFLISLILIYFAFSYQQKLSEFRSLGLFGLFLINLLGNATLFLPAPAIASVVAGGILYPFLAVALVSALGATIGDMVGFLLGRSSKEIFIKNHHSWYLILERIFKKYGPFVIFLFAFIPNPVFDAVGIMAGVFSFSPIRFFILVFLGRFARDILLAFLGSHL